MMNRNLPAAPACALLLLLGAGCGSKDAHAVPDVIVTIIDMPANGVSKNASHIYWNDGEGLARSRLEGGPIERLPIVAGDFAVDESYVYYVVWLSGHGGPMKRPLEGGDEVQLAELGWQTNGGGGPRAVSGAAFYWADANGMKSVPIDGGEITELTAGPLYGFALDATSLYWTDGSAGTVKRTPLDGSGPEEVIASAKPPARDVAVGGSWVCWLSETQIHRASKEGGSSVQTTSDMGRLIHLVADAEDVYWIDDESSELRRMPLEGGEVVTLATHEVQALYLAVDDAGVYWISRWDDHHAALKRLRK